MATGFGSTTTSTPFSTTFNAGGTTGSLFGSANQSTTQPQSLFGANKPPTFGSLTTNSQPTFGAPTGNQPQSGMFGATTASFPTTSTAFGQSTMANTANTTNNQLNSNPTITASTKFADLPEQFQREIERIE